MDKRFEVQRNEMYAKKLLKVALGWRLSLLALFAAWRGSALTRDFGLLPSYV